MQEPQSSGKTDSELWRNSETRWLQLFGLVERQCQERVAAQQEQFHGRIQRIQEEIRNLVKLQTSHASRASSDSSLGTRLSSDSPMGFFSESSERNESVVSHSQFGEPDMQRETPAALPDCSVDGGSLSSGYGTFSVTELSPCKAMDHRELMEPGAGALALQAQPPAAVATDGHMQPAGECGAPVMEDTSASHGEFEHDSLGEKISEVYSGKTGSKAVTSWAEKLRRSQPKRAHGDAAESLRGAAQTDCTAAARPRAFYLCQPGGRPPSWTSASGTGLTYWKLEGKDACHSLHETLEKALAPSSEEQSPSQFNASNEMTLPSLKDIYHKKQRGNKQLPERNLTSASNLKYPPEVLTLDPVLHMRPSQPAGTQPQGFGDPRGDRGTFSPDLVLEPSVSNHSDTDSFSQASHSTSHLPGFPKYPSGSKAPPVDCWSTPTHQNESRTSFPFPSAYTITSSDVSVHTVEEGDAVMVTAASVGQCQLPGTANSAPECISLTSLEDPVIMSKIRQNLKEKHARHIADLRAYYESEINSLKQKLEAKETSAVEEWRKTSQILVDRCSQLDIALNEATSRVRTLENKNNLLEIEVSDFRDRFSAASGASRVLQERIEEMRASSKEKDSTILRLQSRLQDLEDAFEGAYKLSDDKEARLKQENKMFQDLLGEYESLGKEHRRVKDALNTAENRLLDAHTQISDLKRTISKLEAQVKQMEHENMSSLRHDSRAPTRPARANTLATSDVSRRKWLIPGAEYSIFTGQPLGPQEGGADAQLEGTYAPGCHSPPEKDSSPGVSPTSLLVQKQRETPDAPIMKALREFSEGKILKNWGTQTEGARASHRLPAPRPVEAPAGAGRSPERCAPQRPKRLSAASPRSSSLPPSNRKASAPTKREIMLTPVTVAYSPKRSPKENLSPGFSHLLSKDESSPVRFDVLLDDLDPAPVTPPQRPSSRKQLQLLPLAGPEEKQCSEEATVAAAHGSFPEDLPGGAKMVSARPTWEKGGPLPREPSPPAAGAPAGDFEYMAKIRTLAETERFFDELTKEKDQIEAALSRMPAAGGRLTLQTRLNQEALEERLERVNRELGSVRMTLKKFHVLRTSANL